MHHIGKGFLYVLWISFSLLVLGLFVGFVKYDFDIRAYVQVLQNTSLSSFGSVFSSSPSFVSSEDEQDAMVVLSGVQDESIADGLDVYDPEFSEDFSYVTSGSDVTSGASLSGGFGFVAEQESGQDSKQQLLNLIKARDLRR